MIAYLAAAAEPLGGYQRQILGPEFYTLVMMVGWVLLHVVCPLIAGFIYAAHRRTLFLWVAVLAVASYAIHAGQELWSVASYNDYRTMPGVLLEGALFIFAPAFGAVAIGIFIRGMWDQFRAKNVTAGVRN